MAAFDDAIHGALRHAELAGEEERLVLLSFLGGQRIDFDLPELHAALRRSELLLAAGGDPRRPLELHGRAVTALAGDLDEPELRAALATGLTSLRPATAQLPLTAAALEVLERDGALAVQCYAMALLAEALADSGCSSMSMRSVE